jgi:hypothetical protein
VSATAGRGWADTWAGLLGAAVLGTDRRPLPEPPEGLLPDALVQRAGDDATRLLDRAAALTAARRAGCTPDPAPPPLPLCPDDDRPPCPPVAARRLAELLEAWPMLVEEWLLALGDAGCRLPPEHAVALLERFRADPARRALVERAAGPLAAWLVERFPRRLAARRPPAGTTIGPGTSGPGGPAVAELPGDLAALLDRSPEELADVIVRGLAEGRFVARHRPVLATFVCHLARPALVVLAAALEQQADPRAALLAGDLAALARTRLGLHDDFGGGPSPALRGSDR